MDPKSPSSDHHWGLSWWVPQDNNKHKAVLNQAQEGYPLSPRLHSLAQHKGTEDEKAHPQVCSWEWLNFIVSQLLPESLASNQPLSRCYDPFLHWLTARHTASLTGSHKEQRALGNHKGWETTTSLGLAYSFTWHHSIKTGRGGPSEQKPTQGI